MNGPGESTPAQEVTNRVLVASAPTAFQWIDTAEAWSDFARGLEKAALVALDVEADGFHRYPERLSLIQIALPGPRIAVLDPLAVTGLSDLGFVLADRRHVKVLHAASYDVRALQRDLGFTLRGLYDTSIAAQFLGLERTGLAAVLQEILCVDLAKSKRLQRMDWSQRPLPEAALAYAADDVAHLLDLYHVMVDRIADLGRSAWVAEECERLESFRQEPPLNSQEACLQVKGAKELDDQGRAVLHALYCFREQEALRLGRPPYRVMGNETMLTLARDPSLRLEGLPGIGKPYLGPRRRALLAALTQGRQDPPLRWPRHGAAPRWTGEQRNRLTRLKAWREAEAAKLGMSAGLVWSARHLDQLALHPGVDPLELDLGESRGDLPWIRHWQWDALGDALRSQLATLDASSAAP
jgi:ribonuclease D